MSSGYIALLDVLGFSALIGSDPEGERIGAYLESLKSATAGSEVDYVAFSDSIVLTNTGEDPTSLIAVARVCSRLLFQLLTHGVALRGAIAYGDFVRSAIGESVFVAGRGVVDAYHFEQAQDWVGIMLSPSALARVPDLEDRCRLPNETIEGYQSLQERLPWAAFLQQCHGIPFHSATPFDSPSFDGFAIVPTDGVLDPLVLRDNIEEAMKRLKWLRMLAPSPGAQRKYQETERWLWMVRQFWWNVARAHEQAARS